jgi:hypothetical protein
MRWDEQLVGFLKPELSQSLRLTNVTCTERVHQALVEEKRGLKNSSRGRVHDRMSL